MTLLTINTHGLIFDGMHGRKHHATSYRQELRAFVHPKRNELSASVKLSWDFAVAAIMMMLMINLCSASIIIMT